MKRIVIAALDAASDLTAHIQHLIIDETLPAMDGNGFLPCLCLQLSDLIYTALILLHMTLKAPLLN